MEPQKGDLLKCILLEQACALVVFCFLALGSTVPALSMFYTVLYTILQVV